MTAKTVIVTGFGPFGEHKVNASWECVKQLQEIGLGEDVTLITQEMPVEYTTVKETVPNLWQTHQPCLVVHVGVSGLAKKITVEQRAHNNGYSRKDVKGEAAEELCCVKGADECIVAGLDMTQVCDRVNASDTLAKAEVSHDAGRYLCDFSYFTSLHINPDRAAFIHVPPLDQPYSVDELAEGIRVAILDMLRQADAKNAS